MVVLKGLKEAQYYRITVTAYTSKGVGPQSYSRYITTGKRFFLCKEGGLPVNSTILAIGSIKN